MKQITFMHTHTYNHPCAHSSVDPHNTALESLVERLSAKKEAKKKIIIDLLFAKKSRTEIQPIIMSVRLYIV